MSVLTKVLNKLDELINLDCNFDIKLDCIVHFLEEEYPDCDKEDICKTISLLTYGEAQKTYNIYEKAMYKAFEIHKLKKED